MATKHTATAHGQTFTRTSQNRKYSHVVIWRPDYEAALIRASYGWKNLDFSNFHHSHAKVVGESKFLDRKQWETEEEHKERVEREVNAARENLNGCETAAQYAEMMRQRRVDAVEQNNKDGYYRTWQVVGWCSRRDLAEKLAATERNRARVAEVQIIEAQHD